MVMPLGCRRHCIKHYRYPGAVAQERVVVTERSWRLSSAILEFFICLQVSALQVHSKPEQMRIWTALLEAAAAGKGGGATSWPS